MTDKTNVRERQLILLRGMPGAGKSTMARWLSTQIGMLHVEGDQWRGFGDFRVYSEKYNENAHLYAIGKTADILRFQSHDVVVSNVFPTLATLKPYFDIVKELNARDKAPLFNIKITVMHVEGPTGRSVQAPPGKGPNTRRAINAYKSRWEDYNGEFA